MLKVESKRMKLKTKDRGPKPIIGQTEQKWAGNLSFFFIHRVDALPLLQMPFVRSLNCSGVNQHNYSSEKLMRFFVFCAHIVNGHKFSIQRILVTTKIIQL